MSNLEEHMDDLCRTCGEPYNDGGDGYDGECPDCADASYMNEIVSRSAPRWAWDVVDEILDLELDCDGDVVVPGEEGPINTVQGMQEAARAMGLACELANDQPISREDVRED